MNKKYVQKMLILVLVTCTLVSGAQNFIETLYPDWQQTLKIDHVIKQETTEHQDLIIFENALFGRVLGLDGVVQVTQGDEFVYQEMMTHVPLLAHGNAESVLIVGGGDGGILREVARHKKVKKIVLVEIDPLVIEVSKEYLPTLSSGAFNDDRLELIIANAADYVKTTSSRFDVVICDSTDPFGPGAVLFSEEFYGNCKRILHHGGIFVNQNGVPALQGSEIGLTFLRLSLFFKEVSFYLAPVPTYVGGFMAFGWATDDNNCRKISIDTIKERTLSIQGEMKYYTPEIHQAAFALPVFVQKLIPKIYRIGSSS